MATQRSNGKIPTSSSAFSDANRIRVGVRMNDVPRWNNVLLKSGKKNNAALLEWMLQLAEEKLRLDPRESQQEWEEALKKKTDLFDDVESGSENQEDGVSDNSKDDTAGSPSDADSNLEPLLVEDSGGERNHLVTIEMYSSTGMVNETGKVDSSPEKSDSKLVNPKTSKDPVTVEKVVPVPKVLEEQITVEKKGSNAPIRKRFRLRESQAMNASESVKEEAPQTFREPLKVRRKLEKNISKSTAQPPKQTMTLRSREKSGTAVPTSSNPTPAKVKKVVKSKGTIFSHLPPSEPEGETTQDLLEPKKCSDQQSILSSSLKLVLRSSKKSDGKVSGQGPFQCSHCPRGFNNATSHRRHEKAHVNQADFVCGVCNKRFSSGGSLWHHKKSMHEEKNLKCPHCDQKFAVERFLKCHLRKHTGEKPYKCRTCGSEFALASTLRNHEWTHSGIKPFLCDTCGVSFRRKDNLENHIERRHTQVELFSCDLCDKKFSFQASLDNHKIHHQNESNGVMPYTCHLCQKQYTTPKGLQCHINRHKLSKDHVCETCGKVFKLRYYLTKHQAIHLKVKPHVCRICDRGFAQKSNLDIHMRTHTGAKPYSCTLCGKSFAHNVSLKGHISMSHSGAGGTSTSKTKAVKRSESNKRDHEVEGSKERPKKRGKRNLNQFTPKKKTQNTIEEVKNLPFMGFSQGNLNHDDGKERSGHPTTDSSALNVPAGQANCDSRALDNITANDHLIERRVLEDTIENEKQDVPDSLKSNLIIDEQPPHLHYNQTESTISPDIHIPLSVSGPVSASNGRDGTVMIGIPQDISYNTPMSNNHAMDKGQYLISSSTLGLVREISQSLTPNRPNEHTMGQLNGVEQVASPTPPINQHQEHHLQQDLRHFSGVPHQILHNHAANHTSQGRYPQPMPTGSPQVVMSPPGMPHQTGNVSPSVSSQQDESLTPRGMDIHAPASQSRLDQQPMSDGSPHENLSPQPMMPQNDTASPMAPSLQVENSMSQPPYPQNINYLPTFHTQPQPLTITAQSTPLLPNMIRKEQPVLVEGLAQNFTAMIPFRALAPETAAQMVQDPRLNLQSTNIQGTNQPVHLPFRYIEYSQTPAQTSQPSHIRPDSLPSMTNHFNKSQANLPASRMTSSLQQSFTVSSNFVSAMCMEQPRGTPSYTNAPGQRSPVYANTSISNHIENAKQVSNSVSVEHLSHAGVDGVWKQQEARWEASHPHQLPTHPGQTLARDMSNIPAQIHRQLLSDYTRKMIPLHTSASSASQQPSWESPSS
ncbi:hypothetical protein HOLleu_41018 [Holothuria leucospilota]|uniref:C2H2-type domain-containing protein n=1 Tax=Holothuria leucospilota TaxID=206669 RepID=A0A9Q1BCE1_HOLLE|nr:hypothetical protein HOLleu_41018 [Holothuria leucospilota]